MGLFFSSLANDEDDIPPKLYEKIESRILSLEGTIQRLHQEIQSLKYVLATKIDDRPKTQRELELRQETRQESDSTSSSYENVQWLHERGT